MKRNLKPLIILFALVLMIITLTACGGGGARTVPNENRVQEDLAEHAFSFISRTQTIDSIEIISAETDNDAGVHTVSIKVYSHDEEISYVQYGILMYQRNADREWVLNSIVADRENLWSMSPLVGVREDVIVISLEGLRVTIDGDEWRIDEDSIESITIDSQETRLENNRDTVIVTVEIGSDALTAQGQIEVQYTFVDGLWVRDSYHSSAPFVSEYRPHAVFELSNDQLLDEIVRGDAGILREMIFDNGREGQTIGLSRDEISNLTIEGYVSSNKGTTRVYDYSFTLTRGIVEFQVEARAFYQFDSMSGWALERFDFTPNVSAVYLEGTRWIGTFRPSHPLTQDQLIIEITEVTSDGAVRATLIASPPEMSWMSIGTFDFSTLAINLVFDEWIIEPRWSNLSRVNLNGHILADGSTMAGHLFEIRLEQEQ